MSVLATKIIKQIKPAPDKRKSIRKDIQIGRGPSNGIKKELAKFIDSLYEHTDAEYLEKRDTSDERLMEIMTPGLLVPDRERLMQHLLSEPEPYPLKDYPKDYPPVRKKKQSKFEINYQYRYKSVNYKINDIIADEDVRNQMEEQNWFNIYEKKPNVEVVPSEISTEMSNFEEHELEEEEGDAEVTTTEEIDSERKARKVLDETYVDIDKRLEETVKAEVEQIEKSMSEEIKEIVPGVVEWSGETLQSIGSLQQLEKAVITKSEQDGEQMGPSESIEYALKMLLRPFRETFDEALQVSEMQPQEVQEEDAEEAIEKVESELEFLQDPDIPPLPRVINKIEVEIARSEVDEDVISMIERSTTASLEPRTLSNMTVATAEGLPHFKL